MIYVCMEWECLCHYHVVLVESSSPLQSSPNHSLWTELVIIWFIFIPALIQCQQNVLFANAILSADYSPAFLRSPNTLHQVASYLCLLPELPEGQDTTYEKEVLLELLVSVVLALTMLPMLAFEFSNHSGKDVFFGLWYLELSCKYLATCLSYHANLRLRSGMYWIINNLILYSLILM